MNVPTGYTALDMVGFTDKGTYNSATAYVKNDIAHYGGNLWRCLVDDTTGVTPAEGVNWTVFLAEPTSAAEDIIAQVETSSTAAHSYAVGKQLIYNDTLYTVTSAITVGDTLTVGTNITASDSIVDQLDTKANSSDLATVATTGAYSDLSGKPTLGTAAEKNVPASGDASSSEVVMGDDSRLTNARNAADVSAWAKAANKPTYNGAEILTSTAKTGTAQLSISDTVASGTSMDNVVGTMLNNDKTLDTNITSINEALTNEVTTRVTSGAHNFAPITNVTQEIKGVTFTVSDTVKISGTVSTGQYVSFRLIEKHPIDVSLKGKECKLHYDNSKGGMLYMWIEGYDSSNTKVLDKTILYTALDTTFTIPSSTETITIAITVLNTYDGALFDVQPMLILASDPSPTVFVPYAKSNRELTEQLGHSYVGLTPTTGNGNIYVDKVGDIVFVNIQVNFTPSIANAYTKIGQLADGYKPKRGFYAVVVDDNPTPTEFDYVGVSIDGEIKVWCDSTTLRKTRGMISFPVI